MKRVKTSLRQISPGQPFALLLGMLELSAFQIFFMVLHASVMVFVASYFIRGNSRRPNNIVPHSELKRRRRRKKTGSSTQRGRAATASSAYPPPQEREVRDVRDVSEILDVTEAPTLVGYQLPSARRRSS